MALSYIYNLPAKKAFPRSGEPSQIVPPLGHTLEMRSEPRRANLKEKKKRIEREITRERRKGGKWENRRKWENEKMNKQKESWENGKNEKRGHEEASRFARQNNTAKVLTLWKQPSSNSAYKKHVNVRKFNQNKKKLRKIRESTRQYWEYKKISTNFVKNRKKTQKIINEGKKEHPNGETDASRRIAWTKK